MTYTDQNGIFYQLDPNNLTAKIGKSKNAKGDIMIPHSITYENKEYVVISIEEDSFYCNDNIKSISFPEDSCVRSFGINAFTLSNMQKIQFPKSLEILEYKWCYFTEKLNSIELSPENHNFSYLDDEHKIIVGKTDPKNSNFDVLIFACRDIQTVIIPSFIKHISPSAFCHCKLITKFHIEENSQLETIGEYCFYKSKFKSIKFPQTLKSIKKYIFLHAGLKECEFDENCKIKIIPQDTFFCSRLQIVSIPKDVYMFDYNWATDSKLTTIILSPQNPYLTYIDDDHKIIAGKTNKNSEIFDILYFACRDVERAIIPSSIKHIVDYAFDKCHQLKTLEFDSDTSIKTLGEHCFYKCESLQSVSIPRGLKQYGKDVFNGCINMKSFEFLDEIIYISRDILSGCRKLEVLNCPNANIIIYEKDSLMYTSPNFRVNRPPNSIFTNDYTDENNAIRMQFKYNYEDIFND